MQVFYRKKGQLAGKKRKKEKKKRNAREITLPRSILRRFDMYFTLATSVACLSLSLFLSFLSLSLSLSLSLFFILTFPFRLPVFIEPFCGGKDDDSG